MSTVPLNDIPEMLDAEVLGSGQFRMHIRTEDNGLTWLIEQHGADAFLFQACRDRRPCGRMFAEPSPERVAATISSPAWQGEAVGPGAVAGWFRPLCEVERPMRRGSVTAWASKAPPLEEHLHGKINQSAMNASGQEVKAA